MELKRSDKIIEFKDLPQIRARHASAKIVHCHGVFDILHGGHLVYFESSKKFGDVLIVSLTSDKFVNKGPGRPYFNSAVRASMIAALEIVDYVCVNEHSVAIPVIQNLRPDFFVKGPDYRDKAADVTGAIYEEEAAVKAMGGCLVFTEDETFSSSTLINKFFAPWNEDQLSTIQSVNAVGGLGAIEEVLNKISKLKVMILGEPIIDTYVFCIPEAISSKSPSISAKFQFQEDYAGGSLAIANHLSGFTANVELFLTHGREPHFRELLKQKLDPKIHIHDLELSDVPTPRKTRFIEAHKSQRMFELTDLVSDQWLHHSPNEFNELIREGNLRADTTMIADFGHGLFESTVLNTLAEFQGFVAVNAQTNSSNFGFNPYTKHKRFNFLNIDTREVRVAYHDRYSAPLELAKKAQRDLHQIQASFAMTTGPNGAYYFPRDSNEAFHSPAFADSVIDTTGAGDAFFSLASLLVKVGCPHELVPFLGNVFAGLKTKIIGNKSPVTRAELLKAVSSILK